MLLLPHSVRVLTSFLMTFFLELFLLFSLSFSLLHFSHFILYSILFSISVSRKVLFIRFVFVFMCVRIHLSQHIVNVINVWRIFICKLHLSNTKWHINIFIRPAHPSTHPPFPQAPQSKNTRWWYLHKLINIIKRYFNVPTFAYHAQCTHELNRSIERFALLNFLAPLFSYPLKHS